MAEQIKDLIEIQGGYTSYVDLRLELFDDAKNVGRMSRYRPIASHRQAFEKLARTLRVKDKRCYLLTGAYGTGKSHLCLMFANYLQTPAGEKPMPDFFVHYNEADPSAAEDLRSKRAKGRYLVALCEWGGRGDFEEIVLRAVDEALRREGFGEDFDTYYLRAINKIGEWEEFEKNSDPQGRFMAEFRAALESLAPRQTVDGFKKRLRGYDFSALEEFKRIHRQITTAPFTFDKADLLAILTDTLASERFKDRYQGLLVLFDEFGDTMERGNLSPKMFQQFAQLAAETPVNCARLLFVGTAHKAWTDYAKAYNAIDFRTASDRIEEVELTPNGVEDIISAIVTVKTDHPVWQSKAVNRTLVFDGFLNDCTRLKLFDWLTAPKIRKRIIENIYPMHPMATYALLQLAKDVASNNRSVFTFFAGDLGGEQAPGSYGDFIASQPVELKNKLNLYTADRLFDYFSSALSADNRELRETLRELVKDYESSRRELNRLANEDMDVKMTLQSDPLVEHLLRLMLIYEIIQVPNRLENLTFGLYCTTDAEKNELKNRLKALISRGVLYFAKDTNVYEFRKSTGIKLDQLIEDFKKDPVNQPANILMELGLYAPLYGPAEVYLEAKDYNSNYREDKRLRRMIVRVADLAYEVDHPDGKQNYFEKLDADLEAEAKRSDCEGYAIYVLCETAEDIQKAKDLCARNSSERIVVAIPKNPIPMLDTFMEVKALKAIESREEAQNFSTQDKSAIHSRLQGDRKHPGAMATLKALRDKLLEHREVFWLGKGANTVPVEANKNYDAANRVMEKLYSEKRNRFAHDDFNQLRFKIDRTKNVALKEAVEELLDFIEPIIVDTSFAQARGDIRYLQKCLLANGALRQIKAEGSKLRCEFERDVTRFANKLPALAAMVQNIENLGGDKKLMLADWFLNYRKSPYGQGPVALALSLACIRRYFGDSIRIKQDETSIGELPLRDFDTIVGLIQDGLYPQAYLSYRPLRDEERALAKQVYEVFGEPDTAAGAARETSLQEAYNALQSWWEGLPPITRVTSLYPEAAYPHVVDFLAAMDKMASQDPHNFLLDELPSVLGDGQGLAVTAETIENLASNLPKVKEAAETALKRVEDRIVDAVRALFGGKQIAYSGIIKAISTWYDGLDTNQRDPLAPWHTNDSKPLVLYLKTLSDLRETFLERIPASSDYGLKRVADWITDRVDEYVERIKSGKQLIEANKLKVEPPELIPSGSKVHQDGNQILFQDTVTLTLRPKKSGDQLYVTEGHADPTDPNSKREEYNGPAIFEINERKTINFAVRDADGNWGLVQTVELINETKKFEITVQKRFLKDDLATFVFPQDSESFKVSLRSLLKLGTQLKAVRTEQLKAILKSLMDEL